MHTKNGRRTFSIFGTDDGRTSNSLMLEHLDLGSMEEQGTVPGACLTEMLAVFGKITRFHLFNLLAVACVQFQDSDQAPAVRALSSSFPLL